MVESAIVVGLFASGLSLSTPLLFAALGEKLAERAGVLNLGVEGMMLMGAFSGFMGAFISGNIWIGLLFGIVTGASMAAVMGFLNITLRTNQMVAGLAIWLLGLGLSAFLYRLYFGVIAAPPRVEPFQKIDIPVLSSIPGIGQVLFHQDVLVYIALILVPVFYILLYKTKLGLKIRTVGENPKQADTQGVNVFRIRYLAVIVGGALAGIGGVYFSLAVSGSFIENMTGNRGWIAIALVIFGRWNPFGILGACLLFGVIDSLQFTLQAGGIDVPFQFLLMLPYIMAIAVMAVTYKRTVQPAALTIPYTREEK